jgi:cysteinyl-tRNA synthetase
MALHLYDTLRRDTVPFEPRDEGKASLYLCGPTVQAGPHVGHGRGAVVFDVLRRYLTWSGYEVTLVRNVTDVDDKIIIRAARENSTPSKIATRYTREFNDAMDALHVLPPDVEPLATGHILEMQQLIAELIEQDKAYERDGNVLFRVRKFPGYGKLSGRKIDDLVGGDDVVGADIKDDPLDFAMWKAAKPDEPSWPSPWGDGRPGWHIECSAMASKHLGHGFDIHGGGLDLVFPHHENEITQYEAAHGEPFVRYWVHNGMVRMGEEKMSKSLGNIIPLKEAIEEWGPGTLRLWYLSAHHRSPLTFEDDRILDARAAYTRLLTFLQTAAVTLPADVEPDDSAATAQVEAFRIAMDDDLNAPAAIAVLHEIASAGHEQLKAAEGGDGAAASAAAGLAATLLTLADDVLGLGMQAVLDRTQHLTDRLAPVITGLLDQRAAARADKDFARADAIRDQLAAAGVVVEDRPAGSRWYLDAFPAASSDLP